MATPYKNQIILCPHRQKMARLQNLPNNARLRDLPDKDKIHHALQWLRENPEERPTAAARIYGIKKEGTLRTAWSRD